MQIYLNTDHQKPIINEIHIPKKTYPVNLKASPIFPTWGGKM
jgi:hypothetical protein